MTQLFLWRDGSNELSHAQFQPTGTISARTKHLLLYRCINRPWSRNCWKLITGWSVFCQFWNPLPSKGPFYKMRLMYKLTNTFGKAPFPCVHMFYECPNDTANNNYYIIFFWQKCLMKFNKRTRRCYCTLCCINGKWTTELYGTTPLKLFWLTWFINTGKSSIQIL